MHTYLKSLLFLAIFSVLHFGYDLTHWALLTPVCGTSESVFQHLKMAFWAYLLSSAIEYFALRGKLSKREAFWYPRLLSATIVPWFAMLIWYLVPALSGKVVSVTLEVLWSIFASYAAAVAGGIVEKNIGEGAVSLDFRVVVVVLAIVSVFFYVWFSYRTPWVDFFVNPEVL